MQLVAWESEAGGAANREVEASPWLAAYTRPRHEEKVKQHCEQHGIEAFLPCYQSWRRWSDRRKLVRLPLFASYLFVRADDQTRSTVIRAPGFLWYVHNSRGPVRVAAHELAAVRSLLASGMAFDPIPNVRLGDEVEIVTGAMRGICGRLIRKEDASIALAVSAIQGFVRVNLPDPSWIRPIYRRAPGPGVLPARDSGSQGACE